MKRFPLMVSTTILLAAKLGLPIGFDFSRCAEGLDEMAAPFERDVAKNMPHLNSAERAEMARRLARYGVVRKRAREVTDEAQWVYNIAQVADQAFGKAMGLINGPEQVQVANAREMVTNLLQAGLPKSADQTASAGNGTHEANRRTLEQSFGPIDKIDGAHLKVVMLAAAEALVLSETRRLFLKKLIGVASPKQNLDKANPLNIAESLLYANQELRSVVNPKLLDAVSRDRMAAEQLADPLVEGRALLESTALSDFHHQELEANIKFFSEFGIPPDPTFTAYVNALKKLIQHNSTP